jgi:methyl-accepting chemotaxis protein
MARPTVDNLLEGINKVERGVQRIEEAQQTWNDAVQTVNEVKQLGNNIARATKAIVSDAKSLLSGDLFSGGATSSSADANFFPSARDNELEQFRTFNCIFEISCLSQAQFNNPLAGYRSTKPSQVILRSGGGANPKTVTDWEGNGKVEYFMDNLELNTIMANTSATGTTNATGIKFEVTEPLSMGLFLQSLRNAALAQGYVNYLEAVYLLTIEFIGNTDSDTPVNLSGAKRYIPMQLYDAKMRVNEGGTTYAVSAVPYNHVTVSDQVNQTRTTINISGPEEGEGSVLEMLQKGDKSLTAVMNKIFSDRVKEQNNAVKEEIFVVFPKEASAAASTGSTSAASLTDSFSTATASMNQLSGAVSQAAGVVGTAVGDVRSALGQFGASSSAINNLQQDLANASQIANSAIDTINQIQNLSSLGSSVLASAIGKLSGAMPSFASLGDFQERISIGSNTVSETQARGDGLQIGGVQTSREGEAESLVQPADSVNDIGNSSMLFEQGSPGTSPNPQVSAEEALNEDTGEINRTANTISATQRQFSFPANTKVTKIIEEVILASEYGQTLNNRVDDQGMVEWFTIDPQLYIIGDARDVASGGMAKIYVYRVLPMKVHSSQFAPPTAPGAGYSKIANQVYKVYNYIYTGKNKNILDFDIEFNMAFVDTVNQGVNNADTGRGQITEPDVDRVEQATAGTGNADAGTTRISTSSEYGSANAVGGVEVETAPIRNARQFHDAILNGQGDMVQLTMTILGDPYFLSDTGMGNYTADLGPYTTVTADGTMDFQRTEIDIAVNFRTPLDYGSDGFIEMLDDTIPVSPFSGLYKVVSVRNTFQGGEFRQELELVRRRNQDADLSSSTGTAQLLTEQTEQPNQTLQVTEGGPP